MVRELHPFVAETIKVRSADLFLAIAAKVAVSEIIGHNKDDVWGLSGISKRRLPGSLFIGGSQ